MLWLGGLVLLGLAILAVLAAVRWQRAYQELSEAKALLLSAEAALREEGLGATPESLDAAQAQVVEAKGKFVSAQGVIEGDPVLGAIRWLPWLGHQVDAAADLSAIGVRGSEIGLATVEALRIFNRTQAEEEGGFGEKAMAFLDAIQPQMTAIEEGLAAIRHMRSGIAGGLLPPLAAGVADLDARISDLQEFSDSYRRARTAAHELLGFRRPMRYLVLGQDNSELFPTGGVIAVYGLLTLSEGRLTGSRFDDIGGLIDAWRASAGGSAPGGNDGGRYQEPPAPLKRYLLRDWTWNIGVANWSPDFPTAARQVLFFYEGAGQADAPSGEPVDGVIGVDFIALEGLLAVTGPLRVEPYGVTVDKANVTEEILIRTRASQSGGEERHAFAAAVAQRVLEAALSMEGERLDELLESLDRLVREKHLMLYARREQTQAAVRELGWDGHLEDVASDYLMVVDTNVQASKLNLVVDQSIAVNVQLGADGSGRHDVRLSYENGLDEWARGRDPALVYELMLYGFYGDYVRILTPPQAQLLDVRLNGQPVGPEDIGQEQGRASFGRYLPLPRGERASLQFSYLVPNAAAEHDGGGEYRLFIQKQGGTRAIPLRLAVGLPQGAEVRSLSLNGEELPDNRLQISTDLSVDRELVVRYRR